MTLRSNVVGSVDRVRRLLSDESLRTQFLPPLTSEQLQAMNHLLPDVVDSVTQWAARWPVLDLVTTVPVALLKIAQLPNMDTRTISTAVKMEIWVFALDDLFDRRLIPFEDIIRATDECYRLAGAVPGTEEATGSFAASLMDIKSELASHRLFLQLQPIFTGTLARLIDGMVYAYSWQRRALEHHLRELPPLDEYLYHGGHTIAHSCMWSLILQDDETVLSALPSLTNLADRCSRALRLANDLATHRREEDESVPNAVVICHKALAESWPDRTGAWAGKEAIASVRRLMGEEQAQARAVAKTIHTEAGVERSFLRVMDFGSAVYGKYDFRDWIANLIDAQDPGPDR